MTVRSRTDGTVVVVTIDRPSRRNAIDQATADALRVAFSEFEQGEERVAILTGAGGSFCAGADLVSFDLVEDEDGWLGPTRTTLDKPVIAAIEGYAVAGGLELALWADLRVAGEGAVFGCFERRFGVPLVDGGTQRLARIIGQGRALDMILTGRPVTGREAQEIGLVNRLVPDGQAVESALELAHLIAASPQETMLSDRRALYEGMGLDLAAGLKGEAERGRQVLEVARRGAARFAAGEGRSGS
ncbi:MAG: crotonase/enoyl-CoA hydratase family protein [Acidimicrobiia bacterium]